MTDRKNSFCGLYLDGKISFQMGNSDLIKHEIELRGNGLFEEPARRVPAAFFKVNDY